MDLDELREGSSGTVVVMVCRRWDVNSVNGRYMSTDYIVSDKKGNMMHCVARNNIVHLFVDKLQEGGVYSLRGFSVQPNKDTYRILKDSPCIIELGGSTIVRKVADDVSAFQRHPFKFTQLEDLEPTGNKFFVDVIGYVTFVGEPSKKANGAQTVEFSLSNERNRQVRVTLWGSLGDVMIKKKEENPAIYCVILTSMSAKFYLGNLCLSSSSSTLILDNEEIPCLKAFKCSLSCIRVGEPSQPITEDMPVVRTIKELLQYSRDSKTKQSVVFRNTVEIVDVRTKNSWFLYTCTGGKCRKGLKREDGYFKCEGCKAKVNYPRTRYRIQLEIDDGMMRTIVVLFDETGEKLLNRTAKSLLEEHLKVQDESPDASVLPAALEAVIGTKHLFEIKSHTYYHFGEYESFNCAKLIMPDVEDSASAMDNIDPNEPAKNGQASSSGVLKRLVTLPTPSKQTEPKRRRLIMDESDSEDVVDGSNESVQTSATKRWFHKSAQADNMLEEVKDTHDVGHDVLEN